VPAPGSFPLPVEEPGKPSCKCTSRARRDREAGSVRSTRSPRAWPASWRSSSGRMSRDQFSEEDYLANGNVLDSIQTKEGLSLELISGDVLGIQADVIVNTVPVDLQLGRGSLSQALLQKAGPRLQKELNATRERTEEKVGSIFMTSGCNLDCNAVLHIVAPSWDNGAGTSSQIMANIIQKCLTTIEQQSFSSITFPLIGTGNLQFPKAIFAELILSEVFKFSSSAWLRTLQEVHFVVHPDDDEGHQAFLGEFSRWSSRNPNKDKVPEAGDTQGVIGTVPNPWFPAYEMKIGAITFQVAIADITKENVDVIVNSTASTFDGKSGVSKAILEGAGPAVENELTALAARPHRGFIITQGGDLRCDIIIHVHGADNVRKTVSSVLEECEQRSYTSVSLPAIGTGNAGQDPVIVADNIIDAIVDFTRKYSTPSLETVKVVVFVSELLTVFYDSMKKRDTPASPTLQATFYKAAHNVPEHWTDMNDQLCCTVQLLPQQSEYHTVKDKFAKTCFHYTIEKIERIQNIPLWQSYQIKKRHMDVKNGHTDNERLLFHGTDAHSVPYVNEYGFNRSYAGKNSAAYGKGTYFAVDASYSANNTYSKPDDQGRKHMYVVQVLTGDYTKGSVGLVTPPPRDPANPTDLFDSVTDNTQHPTLFVVFSDNQAYPEYLITFRY
uniref:Poly [ADP-ribose] polymerase n=1 Tax=Propithecus coquereli TaxID=379532 RepID=A0A2K6GJP4_PROCO